MNLLTACLVACLIGWGGLTVAIRWFAHVSRPDIDLPPALDRIREWID